MKLTMPEDSSCAISEEEKKQRILELKNLLQGAQLTQFPYDDEYLERFLGGTDFDVEKAFDRIKTFYELLIECPDWFTREPPLTHKKLIEKDIRAVLPVTDRDGRPIYLMKQGNVDITKVKLNEVVAVDDMWLELILLNKNATQKDYRFHIVKDSMVIHAAIKIIWPFVPEHIREMVKFHFNDIAALHTYIDPKILPKEYGGQNIDINYSELHNKLFDKNQEIAESFKVYRKVKIAH